MDNNGHAVCPRASFLGSQGHLQTLRPTYMLTYAVIHVRILGTGILTPVCRETSFPSRTIQAHPSRQAPNTYETAAW